MRITHLGHACVVVETATTKLLIDPGSLSSGFAEVREVTGVLVTHQHADHLDAGRLSALLANNPNAKVYVDAGSATTVRQLGITPVVVAVGERIAIGGTVVDVVGGHHAVVHPDIPTVPNVGYVIDDGAFYHPGDSFVVPRQAIDVLAAPTSGPWLKLGEAIDFVRAVSPRTAVPIHEGALANTHTHFSYLASLVSPECAFVALRSNEPRDF